MKPLLRLFAATSLCTLVAGHSSLAQDDQELETDSSYTYRSPWESDSTDGSSADDADPSVSSSLGPIVPSSPSSAYSCHSSVTPQQREGGSHHTRLPVGRLAKPRLSSDAEAEHRSAWALGVDDRRSPAGRTGAPFGAEIDHANAGPEGRNWNEAVASNEQEQASQHDEGFAAASGKCGDVTTQKIGSFYHYSNGGVTQKIGNFFYGPEGQVTQKIGSFYYHSDGTTTQQIGNFYYDSDGGVTQKICSFYYHSGGLPCEDEQNE